MAVNFSERKCPNCGGVLTSGTYKCEFCGTDWAAPKTKKETPPLYGDAIASIALSLVGFVLVLFLGLYAMVVAGLGLYLGLKSYYVINKDPEKFSGMGYAKAGAVISFATIFLFLTILRVFSG